MEATIPDDGLARTRLGEAIAERRTYLSAYEKRSEPIVYESVRAIDNLFCRELMDRSPVDPERRLFRDISSWGVNQMLRRIVPRAPGTGPFREFESHDSNQASADDFLFNCGALEIAERFQGWLREGIVTGELRQHKMPGEGRIVDVLVLRSATDSHSDEEIGRAGLRWASDLTMAKDRATEDRLERKHRKLLPELSRRTSLVDGWRISYTSTREIDEYFLECAKIYLRRIYSQDLVGAGDLFEGRPFSRYLDVLTALSARSQKHLAFTSILAARHPSLHLRNILTAHAPRDLFVTALARYMDADRLEIEEILRSFVLSGDNLDVHTASSDTAWAPIVQASSEHLILPTFGLDINPFLFLLADLRARHPKAWFLAANHRERRWIEELSGLFHGPRWQIHTKNLRLRDAGKDLTDIDFAVFDRKSNQLALFQLKWQQPVGMDNRGRRSAGRNLTMEGNRWVQVVTTWLDRHGAGNLTQRLGFDGTGSPTVHLFVLGRYHVHLTGFEDRDNRAVWSDWAHFRRARVEGPRTSISRTAEAVQSRVARSKAAKKGEGVMLPVGDLGVLLNPTSVPDVDLHAGR